MNAASVSDIKKELTVASNAELAALCLRLARFKKENKELLTYLLFESHDEEQYLQKVNEELEAEFATINFSHVYYAKKSLRKILRLINKYSRYTSEATTETAWRIHFCQLLTDTPLKIRKDKSLNKMYEGQLQKIKKLMSTMHEDLQYDFKKSLDELTL